MNASPYLTEIQNAVAALQPGDWADLTLTTQTRTYRVQIVNTRATWPVLEFRIAGETFSRMADFCHIALLEKV